MKHLIVCQLILEAKTHLVTKEKWMTIIEKKNHTDPTATVAEYSLTAGEFNELRLAHIKAMASPVGQPVLMPTNSSLQIKAGFRIPNDIRTDIIEFTSDVTIDLSSDTGLNRLDTGTLTTGLIYYLWILKNPTSGVVGAVLSLSDTAPTRPSGFTVKQLYPVEFHTETVSSVVQLVLKQLNSHTSASFIKPVKVWDANVSNNQNAPSIINLSAFFGSNGRMFTASINDTGTSDAFASLYPSELPNQGTTEIIVIEGQADNSMVTLPIRASKSYKSARANPSGDNSFAISVRDIVYKDIS
jgi:hypothetical protein